MSIAAAENAGLGPCDLPDHWATQTATTTTTTTASASAGGAARTTAATTAANFNSHNHHHHQQNNNSSSVAVNYCTLPHSSPAAATAAISVTTTSAAAAGSGVVTASLVGLAPVPGAGVGVTGGLMVGGSFQGIHHLQQQQQQQQQQHQQQQHSTLLAAAQNINQNNSNNNNPTLANNNVNNITLAQQQQQQQQHKAATAAANLAAALQRNAIMNAVASPISATNNNSAATSNRKIRRKADAKSNLPQSQINKCNNEKRRRELENNYIEQLSEFLQLNKRGDMTSTKPDKAAILNQVVKTYRDICDKGQSRDISSTSRNTSSSSSSSSTSSHSSTANASSTPNNTQTTTHPTSTRCTRCATDNCSIHPVQQGEVSSTEPPLPEPSLLNGQAPEISAYFEALEHYISSVGWVLLQVNADGIIESCTKNIRMLIGYEKQELYKKPLYSYLHPADHGKLNPIINNMSYTALGPNADSGWVTEHDEPNRKDQQGGASGSSSSSSSSSKTKKRSISTKVRMLVKDGRATPQSLSHEAMDQKSLFEEVVLIAAPVKDDGDAASSVLCLITRPEEESPLEMNITQHVKVPPIEQLTCKMDIFGKIISVDMSALRESFQTLGNSTGRPFSDFVYHKDKSRYAMHLSELQTSAQDAKNAIAARSPGGGVGVNPAIPNFISNTMRIRLGLPDVYMTVRANSRLFLNQTPGESDFIMSVQTLVSVEEDLLLQSTRCLTPPPPVTASTGVSALVSTLSLDSNPMLDSSPHSGMIISGGLVGGGMQTINSGTSAAHHHHTQTTNVGGPLMTSAVINGNSGGGPGSHGVQSSPRQHHSNSSTMVTSFTSSPSGPGDAQSFFGPEAFDFDFAHSTFEMDAATGWTDSRPNSRASVATPVSTPRPPSGHAFSPVGHTVCASPSTPYQLSSHSAASMPSPQSNASQTGMLGGSNLSSGGPSNSFGFSFPSFESSNDQKSDKDHMNNNNNNNNTNSNNNNNTGSMQHPLQNGTPGMLNTPPQVSPASVGGPGPNSTDSERLRHLLLKPHQSSLLHGGAGGAGDGDVKDNKNILKYFTQSLLNNDEDKDGGSGPMPGAPTGMFKMGHTSGGRMFGPGMQKSNTNNPMLLQLLNEKTEEDDGKGNSSSTSAAGGGRQSELMRQLQKDDGHHGHGHAHHSNANNNLTTEDLKRILKIQGTDPAMTRKRSLNEPDDGIAAKRSDAKPSQLREKNKMLASLLENPPKNPVLPAPPVVKVIPDITSSSVNRVSSTATIIGPAGGVGMGGLTLQHAAVQPKSGTQQTTAAATANTINTPGTTSRGTHQRKQPSEAYLTQQQQQQQAAAAAAANVSNIQRPQQQQQQQQINFTHAQQMSPAEQMHHSPFGNAMHVTPTNATATSSATTASLSAAVAAAQQQHQLQQQQLTQQQQQLTQQQQQILNNEGDPELSKLLDCVMEYVADDQQFVRKTPPQPSAVLTQQEINERMAINAIQKSLMFETSNFGASQQQQHQQQQQQQQQLSHQGQQPPAYPASGMLSLQQQQQQQQQMLQMVQQLRNSNQHQQMQQLMEQMRANNQGFQRPPPMYTARGRVPLNAGVAGGSVMSNATQQQQQQYRNIRERQQQQLAAAQQKERLLQQQQKQQLLVPENASGLGLNSGINNIGSLLNNTVAPNVSLSRTNMPPDSQLSPSFAQSLMQQQLSPGQRNAPFSPQPNQGYVPHFPANAQRLSPQQQQQLSQAQAAQQAAVANAAQQQQQQQLAFQSNQTGGNTGGAQLSPRQAPFGSGNASVQSAAQQQQQWTPVANTASTRLSLQQHNPMLSAQLQVNGVTVYSAAARQFQQQRRQLSSPGAQNPTGLQRQNSFQATNDSGGSGGGGGFPGGPSTSPSPQSPYGAANVFVQQQQQMQRMQRQTSVPQATQHLPAGNAANSSDFVKQELRAVVSGRAQQQTAANAGNNGVPGGGAGGGGGGGGSTIIPGPNPTTLRLATPQSPLGQNSMMQSSGARNVSSMLHTPPDPTMNFSFEMPAQDFFDSGASR